jgi:hypothetical protein
VVRCATGRYLQIVGAAAGGLAALVALTMRGPASGKAASAAFRGLVYDIAPVTAGIGALYTAGSCMSEELRAGKKDWRNSFAGGAAAGAFAIGLKRRSLQAALTGALAMGVAAASADWIAIMEPNAEETQKNMVDTVGMGGTTVANVAASTASRGLVNRLA